MTLTLKQIKAMIIEREQRLATVEGDLSSRESFNSVMDELDGLYMMLDRFTPVRRTNSDRAWQREQAMEAGMLHGVQAYNDHMGF